MFEFTFNKAALLSISLLFTSTAIAIEISADETRATQEFTGNVVLKIKKSEPVTISADSVRTTKHGMEYSGKVILSAEKFTAEADKMNATKDRHGITTFTST